MAKYVADVKRIASIYPGELDPVAFNHGPSAKPGSPRRTVYRLTPVTREKARTNPCIIEVTDAFEDVLNPFGRQGGASKFQSKPVDVQETVDNLLRYWVGGMVGVPPGAAPGIIEIVNTIPSQAEFRQMFEMQTAYAEWLFQEGSRLNRENNWKEITGAMRVMAEWLGREADWINPARVSDMVNCPACGELIMPKVSVCRHCHTRIRALPKELAALNEEQSAVA